MGEAVDLVRSLKRDYEECLDYIDGGAREPSPPDRAVPAVEALEADRDRWETHAIRVAEERDRLIERLNEFAKACPAHVAECDRLRAVVEAVRKTVGGSIQAIDAARAEEMGRDVILRNVSVALKKAHEQLGVSGTMGGPEDRIVAQAAAAHYVSTYCIHGDHEHCRRICKTCRGLCRCQCHQTVDEPPAGDATDG